MALLKHVIATYQGIRLRGTIVGETPTQYVVDVVAADLSILKGIGYPYPCIIVAHSQVRAR